MVCKVHLDSRGNSEWRNLNDLEPHFRRERANTLSLKLHLLPSGFMPTVPNNGCQKSLNLYIQGRWNNVYQRITVQQTNLPHILCNVLLRKLQSALSLVRILSYNFFLHVVSFATLSKPSYFMRERRTLHFVQLSVHMQCFVPIRTNFVRNIEPQCSYLGKFCRQMQLC